MNSLLKRAVPLIAVSRRAYANLCKSRHFQVATIATLAVIASIIYATSVTQLHTERNALGQFTMVRIAASNISLGASITAQNTQEFAMPTQFLLPSTLTSLLPNISATANIAQGDIISTQNSSAPDSATVIPAGMRAVSIVPRVAMPPLVPGTIVDIIANGKIIAAHGIVLSSLSNNIGVVVAVSEQAAPLVASAAAIGEAAIVLSS